MKALRTSPCSGATLYRLGCHLGLVRSGTNTVPLGLALGAFPCNVPPALALVEGLGHVLFPIEAIGRHVRIDRPRYRFGKGGKPVGINQHIGRRPIAAFGNSDGDLQMLQWTSAGPGARFCLYVHHDDGAREYAYDRKDHLARLDMGLDEAAAKGWTVVSMKDDWKTVFPGEKK